MRMLRTSGFWAQVPPPSFQVKLTSPGCALGGGLPSPWTTHPEAARRTVRNAVAVRRFIGAFLVAGWVFTGIWTTARNKNSLHALPGSQV